MVGEFQLRNQILLVERGCIVRKVFNIFAISLILLLAVIIQSQRPVRADWWNRDQAPRPVLDREDRPVFDRDERPVLDRGGADEQPEPTTPPVGGPAQEAQDQGHDDRCEPGESFTGPYCGWSPGQDDPGEDGDDNGGGIGGAEVLGLSDTSSGNLDPSDIIQLAGFLCLLLYAKSKLSVRIAKY